MKTEVSLASFSSENTFNIKFFFDDKNIVYSPQLDANQLLILRKQIDQCLKEWK